MFPDHTYKMKSSNNMLVTEIDLYLTSIFVWPHYKIYNYQVICHQINNKNIFVQNEILITFLKPEKKDQEALLYSFY